MTNQNELSNWQWFDGLDMESQVRLVAAADQQARPLSSVLVDVRSFDERRSRVRVVPIEKARIARQVREQAKPGNELCAELKPLAVAVAAASKD